MRSLLKNGVGGRWLSHCCNHWGYGIDYVSHYWNGSSRPPGIMTWYVIILLCVNILKQNIGTCQLCSIVRIFLAWLTAYHGNYRQVYAPVNCVLYCTEWYHIRSWEQWFRLLVCHWLLTGMNQAKHVLMINVIGCWIICIMVTNMFESTVQEGTSLIRVLSSY